MKCQNYSVISEYLITISHKRSKVERSRFCSLFLVKEPVLSILDLKNVFFFHSLIHYNNIFNWHRCFWKGTTSFKKKTNKQTKSKCSTRNSTAKSVLTLQEEKRIVTCRQKKPLLCWTLAIFQRFVEKLTIRILNKEIERL